MISLTCNNCRTVLTIDDAFAGGACRCQHCGTIQTVPSRLKRAGSGGAGASKSGGSPGGPATTGAPTEATVGAGTSKTLYTRRAKTDGSGLEELAEVVASSGIGSGLVGSGLTSRVGNSASGTQHPDDAVAPWWKSATALAALGGGAIVILVASILWLTRSRAPGAAPTAARGVPAAASEATAVAGSTPRGTSRDGSQLYGSANFCGIELKADVVAYVLDRGSGTRDVFDTLKEATFRSIGSLGADRKFQVILWDNGSVEAYPGGMPAYATKDALSSCRRALEDTSAFNQSDPLPALRKAIVGRAGEVVLVTGKGLDLEPSLVDQATAAVRGTAVTLHTVSIGDSDSPVLRDIAGKSSGEYRTVTAAKLREYAQ